MITVNPRQIFTSNRVFVTLAGVIPVLLPGID
jgi:hypothetical protein